MNPHLEEHARASVLSSAAPHPKASSFDIIVTQLLSTSAHSHPRVFFTFHLRNYIRDNLYLTLTSVYEDYALLFGLNRRTHSTDWLFELEEAIGNLNLREDLWLSFLYLKHERARALDLF